MENTQIWDMIVVGGGPGGCTAALYGARAGLDTLMLEQLSPGGQMALTEAIDNYPGFEEGIDGFTLAEQMQRQAERFGARTEYAQVTGLDLAASAEWPEAVAPGRRFLSAGSYAVLRSRPIFCRRTLPISDSARMI